MSNQEEVQGIVLKLTEEDIRLACVQANVPFAGLVAIWRRFRAQDDSIQMADVLYVMALARSKNLNPLDNNYALIPRSGNKGFSLTFTRDAALQVITKHPEVKRGTMKRWFIDGKGQEIPWSKSPSWKSLQEIDWALEAHVTVENEDGVTLEGVAKYRNSFAAGNDGNPKFLWQKDAGGMTMKQAYKDLANTQFGGGLPDEEETLLEPTNGNVIEMERGTPRERQALPPATGLGPEPSKTTEPVVDLTVIVEKGAKLGMTAEAITAACKQQVANGMSVEAFEKELDKEIESRAKAAAAPTRTRRAAKAEEPKADAPAKPKKDPKPRVVVEGTVDAVKEMFKELKPRKEGDPPGKQPYMVISVNKMDMTVWHKSMFDAIYEAHQSNPQKSVKIGYVVTLSKDEPPREFAEVEEFEILNDTIFAPGSAAPSSGSLLFNF